MAAVNLVTHQSLLAWCLQGGGVLGDGGGGGGVGGDGGGLGLAFIWLSTGLRNNLLGSEETSPQCILSLLRPCRQVLGEIN